MRKILETLLEPFGLNKAEIGWLADLLSRHLTLYTLITCVLLLLFIAIPIVITRPIADRFDRRAKARERQERVRDITIAAYYEMAISLKAMVGTFDGDQSVVDTFAQKIRMDTSYFPLWTFDDSELPVYENYVKKDIAIFPSELIGTTVEFYQASQYFLAYLKDARSEAVLRLSTDRKVGFVKNVYSAAFEYIEACCTALIKYEAWIAKPTDLSDLAWLPEKAINDAAGTIGSGDLTTLEGRRAAYQRLGVKFKELAG